MNKELLRDAEKLDDDYMWQSDLRELQDGRLYDFEVKVKKEYKTMIGVTRNTIMDYVQGRIDNGDGLEDIDFGFRKSCLTAGWDI